MTTMTISIQRARSARFVGLELVSNGHTMLYGWRQGQSTERLINAIASQTVEGLITFEEGSVLAELFGALNTPISEMSK